MIVKKIENHNNSMSCTALATIMLLDTFRCQVGMVEIVGRICIPRSPLLLFCHEVSYSLGSENTHYPNALELTSRTPIKVSPYLHIDIVSQ